MSPLLQEVLRQVEQLALEERLDLIRRVAEGLQNAGMVAETKPVKHRLSEFRGIAPNLLAGRDAQVWVNELRGEWEERETQIFEGV